MTTDIPKPPPPGYESWLEYAIACLNSSGPILLSGLSYEGIQAAARAELDEMQATIKRLEDELAASRKWSDKTPAEPGLYVLRCRLSPEFEFAEECSVVSVWSDGAQLMATLHGVDDLQTLEDWIRPYYGLLWHRLPDPMPSASAKAESTTLADDETEDECERLWQIAQGPAPRVSRSQDEARRKQEDDEAETRFEQSRQGWAERPVTCIEDGCANEVDHESDPNGDNEVRCQRCSSKSDPRNPAEGFFPPGHFIQAEMDKRGLAGEYVAERLNYTLADFDKLLKGSRFITKDDADALEALFGTSADYWGNLEAAYRGHKEAEHGK